jgi:hypothetical protein
MFMNKNCKSSEKLADIYFYLTKSDGAQVDSTVTKVTSNSGTANFYAQLSKVSGQAWLIYDNLPIGTYTVKLGKFNGMDYSTQPGTMPFTVQTFSLTEKAAIL